MSASCAHDADRKQKNGKCLDCYHAAWRKTEAGKKSTRKYQLKYVFNTTPEDVESALLAQGGRCAICGTTDPGGRGGFHVDHDRNCCPGKKSCGLCLRGLLCALCNTGLGSFRDDPFALKSAMAYLAQYRR